VIGVLYAVNRSPGEIGDRAQTLAVEFAGALGPALGAAMHARRASRLSALEERQRISRDLHDNLSPLLFGIGTAVRRTSDALPAGADDLLGELRCIEARVSQAASSLRDILRALAPANSEEGLPAVVRMDVSSFAGFTGLAAELAVIGEPYELSGEQESVLVAVVREGLHNVARHAHGTSVMVTLHYGLESADVLIQDDGTGLPENFTVTDVPRDGSHYGLASLSQRVARVGGDLELRSNQDGGMTLHASLPTGTG
jgi:signal transduction histidine kinase